MQHREFFGEYLPKGNRPVFRLGMYSVLIDH